VLHAVNYVRTSSPVPRFSRSPMRCLEIAIFTSVMILSLA
jgi:hypothetical protein